MAGIGTVTAPDTMAVVGDTGAGEDSPRARSGLDTANGGGATGGAPVAAVGAREQGTSPVTVPGAAAGRKANSTHAPATTAACGTAAARAGRATRAPGTVRLHLRRTKNRWATAGTNTNREKQKSSARDLARPFGLGT